MEGAGGSVSCRMQTTERLAAQFGSWPPPPPTPTTLDRVGVADVQAAPAPVPAPRMRPRPATQADKGSRTGGGKAREHRFVKEALKGLYQISDDGTLFDVTDFGKRKENKTGRQ